MKYLLLLILIGGGSSNLYASGNPHHDHEHNNTVRESSVQSGGIALAIATAQHQFEWDTYAVQGSLGVGTYDGNNAISLGIGGRLGKDRMLVNGSIGLEKGKAGIGAGINWRF